MKVYYITDERRKDIRDLSPADVEVTNSQRRIGDFSSRAPQCLSFSPANSKEPTAAESALSRLL